MWYAISGRPFMLIFWTSQRRAFVSRTWGTTRERDVEILTELAATAIMVAQCLTQKEKGGA